MRIPKNLKALSKIAIVDKIENGFVNGRISPKNIDNFDLGDHWFQAKIFDEPSQYGINDGRISKLAICEGYRWNHLETVFTFDRGFDTAQGVGLDIATIIVNAVDGTTGGVDFTI